MRSILVALVVALAACSSSSTTPVAAPTPAEAGAPSPPFYTGGDPEPLTCENGGSCGTCTDDTQCITGRCLADGTCALASSVRLVDNGPACGDGTHSDGKAVPYCELADAIPDSGQVVLQLVASNKPYKGISIKTSNGTAPLDLTIIGAGLGTPVIGSGDGDMVYIYAEGRPATFTLRNLTIAPTQQTMGSGVECEGTELGSSLRVFGVTIEGTRGAGIWDSGCPLDLEHSTLHDNAAEGLYVLGAGFSVGSTEISANAGRGVVLTGSHGTLSHVTIVGNSSSSATSGIGIACDSPGTTITDSIVALNGVDVIGLAGAQPTGVNIGAGCAATNVAHGTLEESCAPVFVDAPNGDFHLDVTPTGAAANLACTIDRGQVDGSYLDRDGVGMLGLATDLGAYEAE